MTDAIEQLGMNIQAKAFSEDAAHDATNRMGLPSGGVHQLVESGAALPFQERDQQGLLGWHDRRRLGTD
jgi:hypothetical protein